MNKYMISRILFGLTLFLGQINFFDIRAMSFPSSIRDSRILPDGSVITISHDNKVQLWMRGKDGYVRYINLPNQNRITFNKKKNLLLNRGNHFISCKECKDLSDLQVAILENDKEKIISLLHEDDITEDLINFARKYADDKNLIESLSELLERKRSLTKEELDVVLPIEDLQNISLDYLNMP